MIPLSDFSPSVIADNILCALHDCSKSALSKLAKKKLLKTENALPVLTHSSLKSIGLSEYAISANVPLCYFFYGTHTPPTPTYTPFDGFVIALLNQMSDAKLAALKECMYLFFPNAFYDMKEEDFKQRTISAMRQRIVGTNVKDPTDYPAYKKIDNDNLTDSLQKYARRKYSWIKVNQLIDISTYIGVSIHWLLNIKDLPLYCRNTIAEEIFDYYTLLPQHQWEQFLYLLWYYYGGAYAENSLISL